MFLAKNKKKTHNWRAPSYPLLLFVVAGHRQYFGSFLMNENFAGLQELFPEPWSTPSKGCNPFEEAWGLPDFDFDFDSPVSFCNAEVAAVADDGVLLTQLQDARAHNTELHQELAAVKADGDKALRAERQRTSLLETKLREQKGKLHRSRRRVKRLHKRNRIASARLGASQARAQDVLSRISDQRQGSRVKRALPASGTDDGTPPQKKKKEKAPVPASKPAPCTGGKVFVRTAGFSFGRGNRSSSADRQLLALYERTYCGGTCARCHSMTQFYDRRKTISANDANVAGGPVDQLIATLKDQITEAEPACVWNQCKGTGEQF